MIYGLANCNPSEGQRIRKMSAYEGGCWMILQVKHYQRMKAAEEKAKEESQYGTE